MATNTLSNRGYRSSMRPEQLETRLMLSASPADHHASLAAHEATAVKHGDAMPDAVFDLGITGTEIQFSPIGTPSFIAGSITFVAANGNSTDGIGFYQENLTPIFMDVNGDLVPDFVGTNGVATFSFYAGRSHDVFMGSITTVNTSYIQGMTANGEMLVGSMGTITASDGMFRSMAGDFTSQSVVALFPAFAMSTAVHFVITDCRLDRHFAANVAGILASSLAEAHQPRLKALAVHALHGGMDGGASDIKADKHSSSADDRNAPMQSASNDHHVGHAAHDADWWAGRLDRWSGDLASALLGAA